MMKVRMIAIGVGVLRAFGSCKKSPTEPMEERTEDWSYPAKSQSSITLVADDQTLSVNDRFDVKLVFYNLASVFAASAEIRYSTSNISVEELLWGDFFGPESAIIRLDMVESGGSRVSFGVSYKGPNQRSSSGSGVVLKLKCIAHGRGSAEFSILPETLEVRDSTGQAITGLGSIPIESSTVTIQ